MADDIWVIDGDAKGIEAAVAKAIAAHSRLISVEKQHIEVVKKLDKEGEAGYAASLKGLDKTGNQVIKTYNLVGDKLKETQAKVKETFSSEADTSAADKQLALINAQIKTKRNFEAEKVKAAKAALDLMHKEAAYENKIFDARRKSAKADLKDIHTQANAENKLFDKRRAEAAKQLQQQDRKQVVSQVRTRVVKATPVVADANIAEQLGLAKANNALLEFVQKSKLSAEQVNRIWGEVADGKIKRYEGELGKVQQKIRAVTVAHGKLGKASRDAATTATSKANKLNAELAKQKEALKGLNFSWQTMFRLIISQAASRAVGALTAKIHEASVAALEFEQKLAAVQTIDKTQAPFQSWVDSLRQLSDSRGIDIIDQTSSAYQALSNQVGEGLQTITLLREANDLAITGMASSTDTVNLLSSAINAFNIPVEDAKAVAASFFKTVELGRNTIPEMATSFGRLALPAAQLGISLNEVQAAIATTTINGVKFDVASTFLRNTLLALAKPSDDLKGFLHELGFESGEAAIGALGLGGFLGELEKKAKGSSTEISSLFRNIRAISGATVFAGKGLETYQENLGSITKGLDTYDSKVKLVTENAGKQFEIASNQISNMFTIDNAVPFLLKMAQVTDGFKDLVKAAAIAKDALLVMGAVAIPVLVAGMLKATVAFAGLATAFALTPLGAVTIAISAIAGGMALLAINTESAGDKGKKAFQEWKKGFDELNAKSDKTLREMEQHAERYAKSTQRSFNLAVAQVKAAFNNMETLSKGTSKAIERDFEAAGAGAIDSLDQMAKASEAKFKAIESVLKGLDVSEIQDEIASLKLDNVLGGLNADDQLKTLQDLTDKLRETRKEAAQSGDSASYLKATKQINTLLERQVVLREKDSSSAADKFLDKQLKVTAAVKQYGLTSVEAIRLVGSKATKTFSELSSQTDSLIQKARSIETEILDLEMSGELFGKSDAEQVIILTRNIRELAEARRNAADIGNLAEFNTANSQLNKLLQQRNKLNKGDTTDNSAEFARLQARKLAANALGDLGAASRAQSALNTLQRESVTLTKPTGSLSFKREELELTKQLARASHVQTTEAAKRQKASEQKQASSEQQDSIGIKSEEVRLNKLLSETLAGQSQAEQQRFKVLTQNKESLQGLYKDLDALKVSEFKGVKEITAAYAEQYSILSKIKNLQAKTGTGDNAQIDARVGRDSVNQANQTNEAQLTERVSGHAELSRQTDLSVQSVRDDLKALESSYRSAQGLFQGLMAASTVTSAGAISDEIAELGAVDASAVDYFRESLSRLTDGATVSELIRLKVAISDLGINFDTTGAGQTAQQLLGNIKQVIDLANSADSATGLLSIQEDLATTREGYQNLISKQAELGKQMQDLSKGLNDITGVQTFNSHLAEAASNMKAMELSAEKIGQSLSQYTPKEMPAQYLQVAPTSVAPSGVPTTVTPVGDTVNFNLATDLGNNPSQVATQLIPAIERGLRYRQTTRG